MKDIEPIIHLLSGLSAPALVAIVIISGFALAGFAIYAVLSVVREKRS